MSEKCFETPIVLIVFKRARPASRVFEAISRVRPAKLLIVADGPRAHIAGEAEACQQVREMVCAVDWPCELLTNFAMENLGPQERIISGLNWAFSLVDEAIILEHDCLPDASFFPFCQEMLDRYRGDPRVGTICGTNLVEKYLKTEDSYYFSQLGSFWGWATWKSEWQRYDRHLKNWPKIRASGVLSEIFMDSRAVVFWTRIFDLMHRNIGPNTWDYQLLYTNLINNALTIVPHVNLVTNIGFGPEATYTTAEDSRLTPPVKRIEFPLRHPPHFIPLRSMDRRLQKLHYAPFAQRVKGNVRSIGGRLFRKIRG